jgi:hypothetical protein
MDSTTARPAGSRREKETGTAQTSGAGPYKESAMSTGYPNSTAAQLISSNQVDWWTVHRYFERLRDLLGVQGYPAAGTPAWDILDDDDPAKWLAVLDYGQHHALRVDTAQEAQCAASRDVSKALDWPTTARRLQDSAEWYAANPWMRRTR